MSTATALGLAVAREVARFTDAGLDATADVRDANPPCVLVNPPDLVGRFAGGMDASWSALLIAPNIGALGALDVLGVLLDAAMEAVPVTQAQTQTITVDGMADSLPAYLIRWTGRIPA